MQNKWKTSFEKTWQPPYLKVVNFHVIVFKSSGFKAVAVDSEDDENIVFKNILNFSWKVISRLFSCWIDEILTTFLDLMKWYTVNTSFSAVLWRKVIHKACLTVQIAWKYLFLKKTTSFQLLSVLLNFQFLLTKLNDFLNALRSSCYHTLVFMNSFLFRICWFAASTIRFLKEMTIFFKSFRLKFKFFTKFKIFSDFCCNSFANFVQSALTVLYKEFNELSIISASFVDIMKWITS